MYVKIGPYKNWFGPYQLAEKLCFWAKKDVVDEYGSKDYPDYVFKLGEWLAYGKWRGIDDIPQSKENLFRNDEPESWLYRLMQWYEKKRKRNIKIRIDKYDTWSMDHTLALIVLPMLKQLKETKHGSPTVDIEDVPEHMRTTATEDYDCQTTFDFYNDTELCKQNIQCDVHDRWNWVMDEMIWAFECLVDDDKTWMFEKEEEQTLLQSYHRMQHALMLFGKYFRGLWD